MEKKKKEKEKGPLLRIMEPVIGRIKMGIILAGFGALAYTLGVCAFSLAIGELAEREINLANLGVNLGVNSVEISPNLQNSSVNSANSGVNSNSNLPNSDANSQNLADTKSNANSPANSDVNSAKISSNLQNSAMNSPEISSNFTLIFALIFGAILMLFEYFARMFAFGISHRAAFLLEKILRTDLSAHLARIPYGEITTRGTGALKKVMLDDVKALHAFVADTTPTIGRSVVAPLSALIALFWLDWRLAILCVLMLIAGIFVMSFAYKDNAIYRKKYDDAGAQINASIVEFIQAMPVVRTFNDGALIFSRYENALENYDKSLREWLSFSAFPSRLAMSLLSPVPMLLMLAVAGSYFYTDGSLALGRFVGAMMLGTALVDALMPLMFLNNYVQKSCAAAGSILEILDIAPLEICAQPKMPNLAQNALEFKNVSFKYPARDEFALKDVSFTAQNGRVTALIGASGAGKSTAAKLIVRFWDVNSGEILVGGVNIKQISPQNLMNLVSFVFQDTFLFNETIFENIAKAKPGATLDEVKNAAKAAQIDDFIESLPHGYDTIASERGTNLSGGQKQRITIARAILRDAPIIVLDEATAFADPQNEAEIIKAVSNLIANKTTIIIAHRLSTIKNADEILLFDSGKIAGRGTHDELIKTSEIYKKMWENYENVGNWSVKTSNLGENSAQNSEISGENLSSGEILSEISGAKLENTDAKFNGANSGANSAQNLKQSRGRQNLRSKK